MSISSGEVRKNENGFSSIEERISWRSVGVGGRGLDVGGQEFWRVSA